MKVKKVKLLKKEIETLIKKIFEKPVDMEKAKKSTQEKGVTFLIPEDGMLIRVPEKSLNEYLKENSILK